MDGLIIGEGGTDDGGGRCAWSGCVAGGAATHPIQSLDNSLYKLDNLSNKLDNTPWGFGA
jgi:hypothetical protein